VKRVLSGLAAGNTSLHRGFQFAAPGSSIPSLAERCGDPRTVVVGIGPLATINCKPRQARKGATVAGPLGAGVWLVSAASHFILCRRQGPGPVPERRCGRTTLNEAVLIHRPIDTTARNAALAELRR